MMFFSALICACMLGAQENKSFIERFDQLILTEAINLLIEESYASGHLAVSAAFTPNEPVGELKQSFANGFQQLRLSTRLPFDLIEGHITIEKSSVAAAVEIYKNNLYDSAEGLPSLIAGIRDYLSRSSATVVMISFSGGRFRNLASWFVYVILDKDKKWRIDTATPILKAPATAGAFLLSRREYSTSFP